jgi:hypothetical protein
MGELTLGDRPMAEISDPELVAWMNEATDGNRLQRPTAALYVAVFRILDQDGVPATARHLFYALTARGLVPKSERGYARACYHLLQMRRRGLLPYGFIADNTRQRQKAKSYDGLGAYLQEGAASYRRAFWATQADYVEVWTEKDAIAGILAQETLEWDVPLVVVRGFVSETFAFEAADAIKEQNTRGKVAHVYYFGDWDPSGVSISEDIQRKLAGFGARLTFTRLAVTREQIEAWRLPTRPIKRGDTRAKSWEGGECVEVDAIPARVLRQLCREAIERHADREAIDKLRQAEALERRTLQEMAETLD